MAATENAEIVIDPNVPVIYVPVNARLFYVQSILQLDRPPALATGKTAYILYDYARGETLGYREGFILSTTTETQEIITHLRLIVAENGKFQIIERAKATGGEGSSSLQNLVENAFHPLDKLPGSSQSVLSDLEEIIGYAGGIDMLPALDYQRKVALLTFALSAENWAERRQAAQALGALDPLPVSSASALIPLLANQTEDRYAVQDTLRMMAADPQAFDLLLAALKDPAALIRQNAASALRGLDPTPAALLEPFLTLFYDEDSGVREEAALWLSYYGDPAVVPAMIAALSDKNPEIRQAAAQVLREYAALAAQAVPDLTGLLQDSSPDVRTQAAQTLGSIGVPAQSALPELVRTASSEADYDAFTSEVNAIAALSGKAEALPVLRQALTRDDSNIRGAACSILSSYQGIPGAVEALRSVLNDQDYYVRRDAFSALAEFGSEAISALPALTQIAQNTADYTEFKDVLAAIGAISGKMETLPFLKQSLTGDDVVIRRAACVVLASYEGVPGVEEALNPALQDSDETVRQCSAEALARISSQPAASLAELIQTAENETDPDLFYDQIRSITVLSGKPAALPALIHVLAGNQVEIRAEACAILAQYVGIPGAVEALIPPINDADASVRQAAAKSLQAFGNQANTALSVLKTAAGNETDGQAFEAEIKAIAAIAGPAEAFPLIQAALNRSQADIRSAAAGALKVFQGVPGAIDLLITLMHDGDEWVRVNAVDSIYYYGSEGKKAVPDLIAALGNPQDYYVYLGAATTLGGIGPEASPAVPALVHMVQTAGDLEKYYPLNALGKIGPAAREAVPALMEFLNAIPQGVWADQSQTACLEALRSITQEDFGMDIQKWNAWWALTKNNW